MSSPADEPAPLSADEAARLLDAMRASLPLEHVEHYLALGSPPWGAPDNVRYIYAECQRKAALPAWYVAKYRAYIRKPLGDAE